MDYGPYRPTLNYFTSGFDPNTVKFSLTDPFIILRTYRHVSKLTANIRRSLGTLFGSHKCKPDTKQKGTRFIPT